MGITGHYRPHNLVCLNVLQRKKPLQESDFSFNPLMKSKKVVCTKTKKPENSNGYITDLQEYVTQKNLNKCPIGIFCMLKVNFAIILLPKLPSQINEYCQNYFFYI